jgi:hypothetical protein
MQQPIEVVAAINIIMTPRGEIMCQTKLPGGRPQFNMMLETAKQDFLARCAEMEASKSGVEVAPPSLAEAILRK